MSLHPTFKKVKKIKYLLDGDGPFMRSIRQMHGRYKCLYIRRWKITDEITYQLKQKVSPILLNI